MEKKINNDAAQFAFQKVSDIVESGKAAKGLSGRGAKELADGTAKEFRSLARSFPSMLQKNGFGAAIAFLYSKSAGNNKSNAYSILYRIIEEGLRIQPDNTEDMNHGKQNHSAQNYKTALMKQIVNMDSGDYRIYTDKTMKLCLWIKRFAEGMIQND